MAQTTDPYAASIDFIVAMFGTTTACPVFFQTLANDKADPDEGPIKRQLLTREPEKLTRFVAKHDRHRRGFFYCVATLVEGASTRNKETVRETPALHSDLDFKNLVETVPEIYAALKTLAYQPSIIVYSGGGLHCYWLFKQALDTQAEMERIENALRRLAEILGSDPAVCEVSRLMRLPATHNSKYGDVREVKCERLDPELRYDLDELEAWLATAQPILTRKPPEPIKARRPVAGAKVEVDEVEPDNPFTAMGRKWGFRPALDVEAMLEAMAPGNIHVTQRDVCASLVKNGHDPEEIVELVLERTKEAIGPVITGKWNWRYEERKVRDLVVSAQIKYPPPKDRVAPAPEPDETDPDDKTATAGGGDTTESAGTAGAAGGATVVNINSRQRINPKPPRVKTSDKALVPFVVADGVVRTLQQDCHDILLTEGEIWLYRDGFWNVMTVSDEQRLRTMIQSGFEALKEVASSKTLALTWKRICEHPDLYHSKVPWAEGNMIVCRNGVLNLDSGGFEPHRPENYARRHIGAEYDPAATCPMFEQLIASMFSDRVDGEIVIGLIQEWAGAALAISVLSREERRALILVGPSRTGKTELARIFSQLFGDPIATPSVSEISEPRFGLSSLYGATAWIRDDAINEGDKLDPQRFKTIVTGERVDIQLKRRDIIPGVHLNLPVLLTANSLPRARDGSDAIFNRSIIVTMTNVCDEAAAVQARTELLGHSGGQSLGVGVFEAEAPGILNWALAGLRRLRERGLYEIPSSVATSIRRFKDENNPVGEWAREAIELAPWCKVERRDLVRAYNGWELELEGDEARAHGGRWLLPRLRSQIVGLGDVQANGGRRYITGIKLTALGLAMWDSYGKASPRNGPGGFAATSSEVNEMHSEAVVIDPTKTVF